MFSLFVLSFRNPRLGIHPHPKQRAFLQQGISIPQNSLGTNQVWNLRNVPISQYNQLINHLELVKKIFKSRSLTIDYPKDIIDYLILLKSGNQFRTE